MYFLLSKYFYCNLIVGAIPSPKLWNNTKVIDVYILPIKCLFWTCLFCQNIIISFLVLEVFLPPSVLWISIEVIDVFTFLIQYISWVYCPLYLLYFPLSKYCHSNLDFGISTKVIDVFMFPIQCLSWTCLLLIAFIILPSFKLLLFQSSFWLYSFHHTLNQYPSNRRF